MKKQIISDEERTRIEWCIRTLRVSGAGELRENGTGFLVMERDGRYRRVFSTLSKLEGFCERLLINRSRPSGTLLYSRRNYYKRCAVVYR